MPFVQGSSSGDGFWHDFGAGDIGQSVTIAAGRTFSAVIQWSDQFGASSNNYDLFLYRADGTLLKVSTFAQSGTQDPIEFVSYPNTSTVSLSAFVANNRRSGLARELELFTFGDSTQQYTTLGDSIYGHPAVSSVIAVGAINAADPGTDAIESFSSRGPSTVYSDFTAQTKTLRQSLDGAAIDGVQTKVGQLGFFGNPFFGTSAAAPHAAALVPV